LADHLKQLNTLTDGMNSGANGKSEGLVTIQEMKQLILSNQSLMSGDSVAWY
jgi:hypothetical protein